MDPSCPNRFDIFEIYRRYCDIISSNAHSCGEEDYSCDGESQKGKFSREALTELLKAVESMIYSRNWILDELQKLMSRLNLTADFSEFSRFYGFVFFMCRENGQKNITVSRAITAWRLVLAGRFRLLNQWCDFVENNQRHNISEDTWRQVLAFSRCVHENLEGYDPEGAWPVLIDEFVEYMYRVTGTNSNRKLYCNCGDAETQTCTIEDPLPGLKIFPGLKRRMLEGHAVGSSDPSSMYSTDTDSNPMIKSKKCKFDFVAEKPMNWEENPPSVALDVGMDTAKQSSPLSSTKSSPCAVDSCLSKGFAGLLSTRSCLQFDQESYT